MHVTGAHRGQIYEGFTRTLPPRSTVGYCLEARCPLTSTNRPART